MFRIDSIDDSHIDTSDDSSNSNSGNDNDSTNLAHKSLI